MNSLGEVAGKPAKTMHFALKGETEVDWRFALPATSPKLFTVVHGPDQRVLRTYTGDDMDAHENKGGRSIGHGVLLDFENRRK